jgi:HEAT repeat protein
MVLRAEEDVRMGRRQEYRQALGSRPRSEWTRFLDEHSNLPGPRADLELVQVAADEGDVSWFESLAADPDEYRATVGAVGFGRLLAEQPSPDVAERLRGLASDPRWRVREGAAMALQRLGDADPARLYTLATAWAGDEDPLVQRAAVAGLCEPRLLRTPDAARLAVDLCATATTALAARPPAQRRAPDVRVLRQALGYCWSVAVAADPAQGLPRFEALRDDPDPDVVWIVRENLRKARLIRVMPNGRGST